MLKEWTEAGEFAGRVRLNPKSKDVIIGSNDSTESVFDIPRAGGPPLKVEGILPVHHHQGSGLLLSAQHHGAEVDRRNSLR